MTLSVRFRDAMVWAAELHDGQTRKGSDVPYVAHLLGVTSLALEHGADEDQAIAALLHDAAEDRGGEAVAVEIERRFGPRVAGMVRALSDALPLPGEAKPPYRARKAAYLAHLETVSPDVLLVSCADKLHNARAILVDYRRHGAQLWSRFNGGRDGTLWYYRALVDVFERRGPRCLGAALALAVAELEAEIAGREPR